MRDAAAKGSEAAGKVTKRCAVCARFRAYDAEDEYCLACGHQSLDATCTCGRSFDYALAEHGDELHCPRCGMKLRGRASGYE